MSTKRLSLPYDWEPFLGTSSLHLFAFLPVPGGDKISTALAVIV